MKQVTAILIGAGQRGADVYASYALQFPSELKIVGVAEPNAERRERFCALHNIAPENSFADWSEVFQKPKFADCVFVCTQDRMHCEPVLKAFAKGYHVLCEKPMSPDETEILAMQNAAEKSGLVLSVCHVLRYSPFFTKIKELLDSGAIGRLVSVQHIESIGYWHMAHSFVRGNWRKESESAPIILAKCCHDIDMLCWLAGSRCTAVSSYGALTEFKSENAPENAPRRCMDGCIHRQECPYYAPRFYLEHPKAASDGFAKIVCPDATPQGILQALKTGPYGRCVYYCDNDVADHQVVNLQFENDVTVNMTMCAFTQNCERTINLMGTRGQLRGNMEQNKLEWMDFASGNTTEIHLNTPKGNHSGSDVCMMRSFVSLIANGAGSNETGGAVSAQSHLVALAAEKSRLQGGINIIL